MSKTIQKPNTSQTIVLKPKPANNQNIESDEYSEDTETFYRGLLSKVASKAKMIQQEKLEYHSKYIGYERAFNDKNLENKELKVENDKLKKQLEINYNIEKQKKVNKEKGWKEADESVEMIFIDKDKKYEKMLQDKADEVYKKCMGL